MCTRVNGLDPGVAPSIKIRRLGSRKYNSCIMRKYLAIVAIALFFVACVFGQSNKTANDAQQSAKQVQSSAVMTATPDKQNSGQTDKAKTDADHPKWYAQPEWWLCILGVPTLYYLIRQIQVMRTQAGHMERQTKILEDSVAAAQKAADAAKISADVAAGLSVPILVIHEFRAGDVGAANVEAFFQCPKIKITVKNYGQTPAILKWFTICCTCEELPDVPVYERPGIILEKIVVQPGAEYTLPNLMYLQRQEFSPEDVKAIVNREKWFRAYGYICYGDILGNPFRRLKFCETVLNIFGGEVICDWHEGLAPPAYTGIDLLPANGPSQKKPENPS
jgi:hypothetical protein